MPGAVEVAGRDLADDALFRPVRSGNAFEDTVGRLLQAIRLGIVSPGEALPAERDLAVRLAVSRDTVREAIRSLAESGFLVARRGRYGGTFVTDPLPPRGDLDGAAPGAAELDDVLVVREILETGAARGAASRTLAAADRDRLWTRLGETSAADVADYRRLDSRWHLTIAELAGAPSLVPLVADNRTRVNDLLDRIPLLEPNIAHSNAQHEAIAIAVLSGDADRAAAAMREHLDGSAALLRGFLG
ncbi:MAG: FadR family transcriptional regulator [Burkholderiaceae bacterium]|nr:FadR family transcriptional regulator [Microbacteriaceae bacterium]